MLCEGAGYWTDGDAGTWPSAMGGIVWGTSRDNPTQEYGPAMRWLFPCDPIDYREVSPSLLIAATRDPALSSVVQPIPF